MTEQLFIEYNLEDLIGTPFFWRVMKLEAQLATKRSEVEDYEATFNLRWKADMRAIKLWQKAHPGNDLVWPDHADLVVWLMEQLDGLRELADAVVRSFDPRGCGCIDDMPGDNYTCTAHEKLLAYTRAALDKLRGK